VTPVSDTQQLFRCSRCNRSGFSRKEVRISLEGVILCLERCVKEVDSEAQADYINRNRAKWNEYQRAYYKRKKTPTT